MLLTVIIATLASCAACTHQEWFSEEILVRPLSANKYLIHFHFEQRSPGRRHHTKFSRSVAQLAEGINFTSVDVALSHGRWHTKLWGLSPVPLRPIGAELRAVLPPGTSDAVARQSWSTLAHTLSGTFCASLNLLAAPNMWAEHQLSSLAGLLPHHAPQPRVLYASSSREPVCTENLTPWLKLLPCRDQAGLAALLHHRPTLFQAEYYSMATHISVERAAVSTAKLPSLLLVQTLTLVLKTPRSLVGTATTTTATLAALLQSPSLQRCPLTDVSRIYTLAIQGDLAQATANGKASWPSAHLQLVQVWNNDRNSASQNSSIANGMSLAVHDLNEWVRQCNAGGALKRVDQDVLLPRWPAITTVTAADTAPHKQAGVVPAVMAAGALPLPAFLMERYVTGSGTSRGQMVLRLHRTCGSGTAPAGLRSCGPGNLTAPRVVCIFQPVPWYIRIWLHTLQLWLDDQKMPFQQHVLAHRIRPARDRQSMLALDFCLHVPIATATVSLSVDFSKAFLGVFEFSADANRGFDIPAALITYIEPLRALSRQWLDDGASNVAGDSAASEQNSNSNTCSLHDAGPLLVALASSSEQRLYSDGLLVTLAAPDFSMPYNVICLTSTVLAVFIGATTTALVKRQAPPPRSGTDAAHVKRRKVMQVVLLVVVFAALAVYLDEGLKEQLKPVLKYVQ